MNIVLKFSVSLWLIVTLIQVVANSLEKLQHL
jgi:hypothetical protein